MSLMDMLEDMSGEKPKGLVTADELWEIYDADAPDVVAIDTESRNTFKWHLEGADPFCFTFSWGKEKTFFLRVGFPDEPGPEDEKVAEVVRRIMLSTPTVVYHNAKYDLHVTKKLFDRFDLPLVTRTVEDTMIMSPILNEHRYHNLNELSESYGISLDDMPGNYWAQEVAAWREDYAKATGTEPSYHLVPDRIMVPYATQDAYQTWRLFQIFSSEMREEMEKSPRKKRGGKDLEDIYGETEIPLQWVFLGAEERGMRIDKPYVYDQIAALSPQIEDLKGKVYELVGWDVNPGSTDDVAKVLQQLEVDTSVWINPRSGKEKLPEWVLEGVIKTHENPHVVDVCTWTLEYRSATKLLGTYFEVLRDESQQDELGQWIVRCSVKQMGARTGRTSVTDPPLQTLPRNKGNVREAFIAREGHKLIFADYSQQELRVLGHYMEVGVKDSSMADILRKPGADLHRETATAIYKVSMDEVTKGMRQNAKDNNFAVCYGAGAKKMMAILGAKTEEEGKAYLDAYYKKFPGIKKLKYATKRNMEGRGYVVTLFGRRHRETDGRYTYKAINSLVQGTSADLTKSAMVKIDRELYRNKMRSKILLMVHDEIIVEAPDEEVEMAKQIVDTTMCSFDVFVVPLAVDVEVSDRWHSKG